eukprot:TRINITY_DN12723_c0_g1_i2.p1 TRINITY_DN12723_c0_g1~~TRINITY_DN12723_c0_g1_i2.p1  ORF type:complete len:310 (-),score=85.27 TRINITY_DN12723_c0_g1_i2:27-956(-)
MYDFFFFKQKTAYEMLRSLVGSEMCIRDSFYNLQVQVVHLADQPDFGPNHLSKAVQHYRSGQPPNDVLTEYTLAVHKLCPQRYLHANPGSLDLESMLERQVETARKMVDAFPPPLTDGTVKELIEEYRKFLELGAAHPSEFLIPTLGVDLAWHAHMQHHQEYCKCTRDMRKGSLLTHDDDLEQNHLEQSEKKTNTLWQAKYGQAPRSNATLNRTNCGSKGSGQYIGGVFIVGCGGASQCGGNGGCDASGCDAVAPCDGGASCGGAAPDAVAPCDGGASCGGAATGGTAGCGGGGGGCGGGGGGCGGGGD